jgi:large subunit ribosomal protein L21
MATEKTPIYAIVEISGKQHWIEKGKFYDINKIDTEVGSKIQLNRVLLLRKHNTDTNTDESFLGAPYLENTKVTATILKHFKGSKIVVYKMKPKKKMQKKIGFRRETTRIIIDNIDL